MAPVESSNKIIPILPLRIQVAQPIVIYLPLPPQLSQAHPQIWQQLTRSPETVILQLSDSELIANSWFIQEQTCGLKKINNLNYAWSCRAYSTQKKSYFPSLLLKIKLPESTQLNFITPRLSLKMSSNFSSSTEYQQWQLILKPDFFWPWHFLAIALTGLGLLLLLVLFRQRILNLFKQAQKKFNQTTPSSNSWNTICNKTLHKMLQKPESARTEYLYLLQKFQNQILNNNSEQVVLSNMVIMLKNLWGQKVLNASIKQQVSFNQLLQEWSEQSQILLYSGGLISSEQIKILMQKFVQILQIINSQKSQEN